MSESEVNLSLFRAVLCLLTVACLFGQDYGGPSVLSRGTPPSTIQPGTATQIRPYVSVNGIYDTGLIGYSVDQNGIPPDSAAPGVEAE